MIYIENNYIIISNTLTLTFTKKNKTIRVQILLYEIIQQIRYRSQRWTTFGYRVNSQNSAIKSRTFLLPQMHENVAKRFLYQQLPVSLTWSKQNYGTENAAFLPGWFLTAKQKNVETQTETMNQKAAAIQTKGKQARGWIPQMSRRSVQYDFPISGRLISRLPEEISSSRLLPSFWERH